MKPRVLVVDDELSMREFLEIFLNKEGYEVTTAAGGAEACELVDKEQFDLVVSDIKMPGVDGIEVLRKVKKVDPRTEVIMITAFASHETAVETMKEGAYDYITKPFKVDEIRRIVANALDKQILSRENIALKQQLGQQYGFGNIIGSDPRMVEIYELIQRAAPTPTNILIVGETGTGKELVARSIHATSPRNNQPFVVINCGAIPGELLESELFGHRRGSFTGAMYNKKGLFEIADGGTLFLDEVGELPMNLQVKLLRAIQERKFLPIGDTQERSVDVRLVSASNRNLLEGVEKGQFREDLYYRLNVIQIRVPPLRERRSDIPMLADHFLDKYSKSLGKDIRKISSEALNYLRGYAYPGNVRELENIIERAIALESKDIILPESLPPHITSQGLDMGRLRRQLVIPPQGIDLDQVINEIETDLIKQAMEMGKGTKKSAAKLLRISFRSLRYRMEKLSFEGVAPTEET